MQQKLHLYNQEAWTNLIQTISSFDNSSDVLDEGKQFQDLCSNKEVLSPYIYTSIFQKEFQKFETTNMQHCCS
jgi:hypothetical protein